MFDFVRRLMDNAVNGDSLYLKGLKDAHLGELERAIHLFEEAAKRYRKDEAVEKLARLRAHQLMVKYKTEVSAAEKQRIIEEVVLRLSKLAEIESPLPPFTPADARQVLRNWMEDKTLFIGASAAEHQAKIEEEAILAELDSALPCELIGSIVGPESAESIKQSS
jgi:tetratricopeptide (TPR) repeat protein